MVIGDGEFVFGGGKNLATVLDKSDHSKAYSANGGDPGWCRRTRRERLARWCDFPKRFQADLPRPAPSQKIFRFRRRANQFYQLAPSFPGKRGVSRSSRTRERMRWTRQRRARKVCRRADLFRERQWRADDRRSSSNISADSTWSVEVWLAEARVRQNRVVLAPVAGVKSAEARSAQPGLIAIQFAGDGDKTNSSPGRARHKP